MILKHLYFNSNMFTFRSLSFNFTNFRYNNYNNVTTNNRTMNTITRNRRFREHFITNTLNSNRFHTNRLLTFNISLTWYSFANTSFGLITKLIIIILPYIKVIKMFRISKISITKTSSSHVTIRSNLMNSYSHHTSQRNHL